LSKHLLLCTASKWFLYEEKNRSNKRQDRQYFEGQLSAENRSISYFTLMLYSVLLTDIFKYKQRFIW